MLGKNRKRSDYLLVLSLAAFHTLMQFLVGVRTYSLRTLDNEAFHLLPVTRDLLAGWVIGLCFIILIVRTTRQLLGQQWPWWRIIGIHFLMAIVFSVLWYMSLMMVWHMFCTENCDEPFMGWFLWYLVNLDKLILLYSITAAVTYLYHYMQRNTEYQLQQSQLNAQLTEARLLSLRSQLHPHFLFNTLNSVACLIDEDRSAAKQMLGKLSDLLRHVLRGNHHQTTSLEEELALLERYVYIEKTRFSDDLSISWEIEPGSEDCEVPTMILQPLVENAIHHGFGRENLHVHISIEAHRQNGHLELRVRDNGKGFNGTLKSSGSGLRITRERLETLYGDNYLFSITDQQPGVCCTLHIPQNPATHENADH